ncbi:hypothetical protein, partial [Paenibacillus sp. MMS18-CY102]|uniref:hypothetical protein n=1 Tax=Paenibacillus sp. MMS18-CY102 TaxID=2682849 RepID=UPI00136657A1
MKVELYVVHTQNEWRARWTLALQVDIAFWRDEARGPTALLCWHEKLSLGHAEEAVLRWHEAGGERVKKEPEAIRLLYRCVREAAGNGKSNALEVPLRRVDLSQASSKRLLPKQVMQAVARRLEGRAALASEALALLAAGGPPACGAVAAGGWSALAPALQQASLRGLLRLRSAVAPLPPPASPWRRLLLIR